MDHTFKIDDFMLENLKQNKVGQILEKEMITIKGPGGGLLPKYLNIVIGRPARDNIDMDYPITWNNI